VKYITPFSNLKNSTGKHKDWYSVEFIQIFCQQLNPNDKHFSSKQFCQAYKKEYKKLELKGRMTLIANLLDQFLDQHTYPQQLKILTALLGPKLPFEEGMFTLCFFLYPVSQFVELFGVNNLKPSLAFIEKLTMRFTGEWAIRPFAQQYQDEVLAQMKKWSTHNNFHVRRLASEGLRARLPWGKQITWVNESPEKTLIIYNKLRNDGVLYVRRSVANSMGDMIKIDEDLALSTFDKWLKMKKTADNLWVIKHAIRTPVKKKNKTFLNLKEKVQKEMLKL